MERSSTFEPEMCKRPTNSCCEPCKPTRVNVKRPRDDQVIPYEVRYEIPHDISEVEEVPFHEVPVIEKMDELFLLKLFIVIATCLYLLGPFDYKNFTPKSHWLEL